MKTHVLIAIIATGSTVALAQTQQSQNLRAFEITNAGRTIAMQRAIAEVRPVVTRNAQGRLVISNWVAAQSLKPQAKALLNDSLLHVNEAVVAGEAILTQDLRLLPTNGVQALANGNWCNWYWYGYQAGIDTWRVRYFKTIVGQTLSQIQNIMRLYGYASAATYLGYYVKFYAYWMDWVDNNGGRRGITLTATWGNLWAPVVNRQY